MNGRDPDEYLPVESAGNVAGIPPRTLRSWVRAGKLPATEGQRGKLVRLGDVLAIAEATGRTPASERQPAGNIGMPAGSAESSAGNVAGNDDAGLAVSPAARAQLEAIRDEWLAPLVARNEELARELGRAEAERDELRQRVADMERPASPSQEAADATEEPRSGLRAWWRRLFGGA